MSNNLQFEEEIISLAQKLLNSQYDASKVEPTILEFWEENKFYRHNINNKQSHFVMILPPPIVTVILHLGHIFEHTFSDFLVRYNKLTGKQVVWIPSCDHAGIATQNVVEKNLLKQNIKKESIGREKFVEYVWEWVRKCENEIKRQCKRFGDLLYWDYYAFTMDDKRSYAVSFAFEKLYNEGFIYRDKYIVNHCPKCGTALSDDEVIYKEIEGALYFIKYPFLKDKSKFITIATVRPETILADVAVAVHPEDGRYKDYIGEKLILPLVGRELQIITDNFVDPKFGTGALKITPAHDFNDYTIGKKHNLPIISVIDSKGKMNENAGLYKGLDRFECRKKIIDNLKSEGFLDKIEDYKHRVGFCYRCETIIEPNISFQWFVRMKPLAQMVKARYEKGEFEIIPKKFEGMFYNWIENIRDWCISRQLWWGHRIPFYTCINCHYGFAKAIKPIMCPKCKSKNLEQDPDVLDTWFSSWLWPLSTTGWLSEQELFSTLYPTTLLTSAWDILFFWDIRMLMAGIFFTGKAPFKTLLIHGLVRDEKNKKFSKSSGNAPDVNKLIEQFGADGLRTGFLLSSNFDEECILTPNVFPVGKRFLNKLWNALKFFIVNAKNLNYSPSSTINITLKNPQISRNTIIQWIYTELYHTIEEIKNVNNNYNFLNYSRSLYKFFWDRFCDWYIEITKESIKKGKTEYIDAGIDIIRRFIVLWHPVAPFITEFIYQTLKKLKFIHDTHKTIIEEKIEEIEKSLISQQSKEILEAVIKLEEFLRQIKHFKKIKGKGTFNIVCEDSANIEEVITLAKNFEEINIVNKLDDIFYTLTIFNKHPATSEQKIYINLENDKELLKFLYEKIDDNKKEYEQKVQEVEAKLNDENFLNSANPHLIENYKNLLHYLRKELHNLADNKERIEKNI
ncbi:MAG: valine--tRNA ligase [Planctomycetota bacterium]